MEIEAQDMHAQPGQPVGQHPKQAMRPHGLLAQRIEDQHRAATIGTRGRVIQRGQLAATASRNVHGFHCQSYPCSSIKPIPTAPFQ